MFSVVQIYLHVFFFDFVPQLGVFGFVRIVNFVTSHATSAEGGPLTFISVLFIYLDLSV